MEASVVCFIGYAVGLLEVSTCVVCCLGDEDGSLDGVVHEGVHDLFMRVALDGVDQCSLGAMGAYGRAWGFYKEGGGVQCSFGGQAWFGGGVAGGVGEVWNRGSVSGEFVAVNRGGRSVSLYRCTHS